MNRVDIMLDIETLGTGTNAAIVQIGAVAFNRNCTDPERLLWRSSPLEQKQVGYGFSMNVDLAKSTHPGVIDPSTVEWWMTQGKGAQNMVFGAERVPLGQALDAFESWIGTFGNRNQIRLWSNGPTFDEMIVRQAFTRYGKDFDQVVSFRQSRCCRTMWDLAQDTGWNPHEERANAANSDCIKHDGLSDAVFQARMLTLQHRHLSLKTAGIK